MLPDPYGKTTIRNLYFDTDDYRLIRRSIEKPVYKEKLRIRSYRRADRDSTVFAELKRKYDGIVYKRRLPLTEAEAFDWIINRRPLLHKGQISREIDYFIDFYPRLHPTVFLSYEREAFYDRDGRALRITFDRDILCRQSNLSLLCEPYGDRILDEDLTLMELKCVGGLPFWLAKILSENKLYKTSFSKYGIAYEKLIFNKQNKLLFEERKEETAYEQII